MGPTPDAEGWGDDLNELFRQARNGSNEALGRLLEHHRRELLAGAHRQLGNNFLGKIDPSSVVQTTFEQAIASFAEFEGGVEELRAWLREINQHRILDKIRAIQTQKRDVDREVRGDGGAGGGPFGGLADPHQSPSDEAGTKEDVERVRGALPRLPENYRQVIALRNDEDLGFKEIAERMNLPSEDAARMLWKRALTRLAEELEAGHET